MAGKYTSRNTQGHHPVAEDDPLALRILKEEHHVFRELFDAAEDASGPALFKIAQELCLRLAVHMTIEEEILYPALKPVIGADEVNEGIVEHAAGKQLMAEIEQLEIVGVEGCEGLDIALVIGVDLFLDDRRRGARRRLRGRRTGQDGGRSGQNYLQSTHERRSRNLGRLL